MAVPKRRVSRSRKGKRRSHHHTDRIQVQDCPQCNDPVLPHRGVIVSTPVETTGAIYAQNQNGEKATVKYVKVPNRNRSRS